MTGPLAGLLLLVAAAAATAQTSPMNQLDEAERAAGWRLLFDGRTTAGWRGYRQATLPAGWQVVDGALARTGGGGDIISVDQYENFELSVEWKVAPRGNSGIFFRAAEQTGAIYENAPEMQVLDDAGHPDSGSRLTSAGANYALHPVPAGIVKPAGEWNQARIVARGAHVEHWLNGVKVVEYELWTTAWEALVKESKFNAWPSYGRNRRGHIGLQDHGDWVAYRNIKIRELP